VSAHKNSQNTDQNVTHTISSVVCVLQILCSVLFSDKLCRRSLRMANLVTTWCQMYIRSSLTTRSDINFPFSPVVSNGQSETHAAVRYLLHSSWLVCGFDSDENCTHFVCEMAA
jgi:hypothetical protein